VTVFRRKSTGYLKASIGLIKGAYGKTAANREDLSKRGEKRESRVLLLKETSNSSSTCPSL